MVYLLNLGTRFSTFLKKLLRQENSHVVALLMSFLRVLLFTLISYFLLLILGFWKAYQNCLVAIIKITTVVYNGVFLENLGSLI